MQSQNHATCYLWSQINLCHILKTEINFGQIKLQSNF